MAQRRARAGLIAIAVALAAAGTWSLVEGHRNPQPPSQPRTDRGAPHKRDHARLARAPSQWPPSSARGAIEGTVEAADGKPCAGAEVVAFAMPEKDEAPATP